MPIYFLVFLYYFKKYFKLVFLNKSVPPKMKNLVIGCLPALTFIVFSVLSLTFFIFSNLLIPNRIKSSFNMVFISPNSLLSYLKFFVKNKIIEFFNVAFATFRKSPIVLVQELKFSNSNLIISIY